MSSNQRRTFLPSRARDGEDHCQYLPDSGFSAGQPCWRRSGACYCTCRSSVATARSQSDSAQNGIALGATITPGDETVYSNNGLLDQYASLVGRMPAIVNAGSDWVHFPDFSTTIMNAIVSRGAMPMWTWLPDNYDLAGSQPDFKLTTIASGAYDDYIRRFATEAKNWGQPFLLRFAHEMNAYWYPWGTGAGNPNGNTPLDFVAAWRHVHDIFTEVGATNAIWVWCVNTEFPGSTPIAQDYPGDAYVDWVAIDGYNFGTAVANGTWQSLGQIFAPTYQDLVTLTRNRFSSPRSAAARREATRRPGLRKGCSMYCLPTCHVYAQ